jgi:hypothetical protein
MQLGGYRAAVECIENSRSVDSYKRASPQTAEGGEMPEIRNCDAILSHLTSELSYFLMRAFQELVQNTYIIFECGGMDRIPAKVE